MRRPGFNPWVGKIPWRREELPTPVLRPGEFHGLCMCSPWGLKEPDKTEWHTLTRFSKGWNSIYLFFSSPLLHLLPLLFLQINFYWKIFALKCCVSFCCIAKWISHTYTCIASLLGFLPIQATTVHSVEFPVPCSMFALVTYFIYSINSAYNSVNPSLPIPPILPFPLVSIYCLHLCLYFCFASKITYSIFRFHYMC